MAGRSSAVVFDLDGTLIDSAPDLHVAAARLLAEEGLADVGLDAVRHMVGEGVGRLVERLYAASGQAADGLRIEAATARFRDLYLEQPCTLTTVLPGADAALARLAERGLPVGLCTNKPLRHTAVILETLELGRYFRTIVAGDSLPFRKPDPRPLLLALARLDRQPNEAVFVGDSAIDYRTARAAGTAIVLVDGGYGAEPTTGLAADARIPTLQALPAALQALGAG